LGRRIPAVTLLGQGRPGPAEPLVSQLDFVGAGNATNYSLTCPAVSSYASDSLVTGVPGTQAEAG